MPRQLKVRVTIKNPPPRDAGFYMAVESVNTDFYHDHFISVNIKGRILPQRVGALSQGVQPGDVIHIRSVSPAR
jgi:hypothetical protein